MKTAHVRLPLWPLPLLLGAVLVWTVSTGTAASGPPPADVVPFAGLSPQDACDKATLPRGFRLHVLAAEPDVVQPIAFCLDQRGRVWVAEGVTYPRRRGNPPSVSREAGADLSRPSPEQRKDIFGGADRILIFEDTNGDHKFDKKTVFLEHLNLVSGLQVGLGGVWIGAAPYLLFVPVKEWDSPVPAGDPQILLDGWNYTVDTHEVLNTFTWGPDGWLYGCHGVFCPSNVGRPGSPETERQWMDAGVWRYHPVRRVFEVFTEGGSNPWGIDFDEQGQLFAEMCVIPHFWNMIPGARIERQGGEHFAVGREELRRYPKGAGKPVHPHIYDDIKQHGDHVHWAGQGGPHAANARSDTAGGGHAHAGVMSYLGLSWPAEYRGKLLLGNIHGQRLNMDFAVPNGSGYVGKHGHDFLNFNDSWSQTLNQTYDQDGSVYVIDWYDKNQCHHNREDGHDRSNGRIYKIVYNNQKVTRIDLARRTDEELAALVPSRNEFLSRHARLLLQERAATQGVSSNAIAALRKTFRKATESSARLRGLWALDVCQALDAATVVDGLRSADEQIRAWALRVLFEDPTQATALMSHSDWTAAWGKEDLGDLLRREQSPVVRLSYASIAQRQPSLALRSRLASALLAHKEDATDHNLPLMDWFALEPLVADQPEPMLALALETEIPRILNFTTRRIAALGTPAARNLIASTLRSLDQDSKRLEMLTGLSAALKGQTSVPMPDGWPEIETRLGASAHVGIRGRVQALSLTFGSQNARAVLQETLANGAEPVASRRAALDALLGIKDATLPATLRGLITTNELELRGPALRALAAYNDPETPATLLAAYGKFDGAQKRDVLNTLSSRTSYAKPLLAAVASGQVSSRELTADIVRQLRGLKDAEIQAAVSKLYGAVREASSDKKAEIDRYRGIYYSGGSQPGNASPGRVVFDRICVQCHTLFDIGGKVGPDITGANRADLNYLLETIIDPNAVIPNEYRATELETRDGRNLTGIVKVMSDKTLVLQTANELLTLARSDIASQRQSELSMMPEGLLAPLTDEEVRDLIYYLTRPGQVPLPPQGAR